MPEREDDECDQDKILLYVQQENINNSFDTVRRPSLRFKFRLSGRVQSVGGFFFLFLFK
jgi:hypothetical protein